MTVVDRARTVVESVLLDDGTDDRAGDRPVLHLYDVEFNGGVLKVTVTGDNGVDLDELAALNRRVSTALDEADPIPGSYSLEVGSPGLERPLRTPSHWIGAIGEQVKIKFDRSVEGDRRIEGVIRRVHDDGVDIDTTSTEDGGDIVRVPFADIDRARTVFVWPIRQEVK